MQMEYEYKLALPLDLQMFAKEGPGGEKTEDATAKKLKDVREEGNVAKSREVPTAASLLALFVCLKFVIGFIGDHMLQSFSEFYQLIPRYANGGIETVDFSFLLLRKNKPIMLA